VSIELTLEAAQYLTFAFGEQVHELLDTIISLFFALRIVLGVLVGCRITKEIRETRRRK